MVTVMSYCAFFVLECQKKLLSTKGCQKKIESQCEVCRKNMCVHHKVSHNRSAPNRAHRLTKIVREDPAGGGSIFSKRRNMQIGYRHGRVVMCLETCKLLVELC